MTVHHPLLELSRLELARFDLARVDPPGPIDGTAARRAAMEELRKVEYHRDDAGVLNRVLDWLGDRLDSIGSASPGGAATLIVVLLLAAALVFAVLRAGRPRRLPRAAGGDGDDPLAAHAGLDHRARARALHAQGQLALAQREWLRAAVQTIEERGVLDPRPGRTGAGLAREAGSLLPTAANTLDAAVDRFDAVWFGRREATEHDVLLAQHAADAVRTARIELKAGVSGFAVPR